MFRLSDDRALVATVDFFTPIVDDAHTFGAIAAANALSDLYAMGARPLFALNLVGWPRDADMLELLGDTLDGSAEVLARAGAFVLGGHSIDDKEPKYGLVALGEVHPDHLVTNAGAKPGDVLVLTKPLGTGILSTALKQGVIGEEEMRESVSSMTTLNDGAAAAMTAVAEAVHAATDVTGFGLLGHLHNLVKSSGVSARLFAKRVPHFRRVRELAASGCIPGGTTRNATAAATYTTWDPDLDEVERQLLSDAQTSGGLLISVARDAADQLIQELVQRNPPVAVVVGEITTGPPATVTVTAAN